MEKQPTPNFIPDVEIELKIIEFFIVEAPDYYEIYLGKLPNSHYEAPDCELKSLIKKSLSTMRKYLNDTLPKLCNFVNDIRGLMTCYEHTFGIFVGEIEGTISSLQGLIDRAGPLQKVHEEAATDLYEILLKAGDLTQKYKEDFDKHTRSRKLFEAASFGLAIFACLAIPSPAVLPVSGVIKMLATATVTIPTGYASYFLWGKAKNHQTVATEYDQKVIKLKDLLSTNDKFRKPIDVIGGKFADCMETLGYLMTLSKPMAKIYEEDEKKEQYVEIQAKAKAIRNLCDSMKRHPYRISKLKITIEFKMKQITEI
ncbi:hypothetical protein BX616_003310 [Lobosporangium transversale]|uniref:Uncharacterized protein n=1 Tax=Lobosporangium transversale TaxID=64571 RepID=A0A1Y2GYQ7_9FUNG|nr:hypothetical protein BCR41DRAFT_367753 [Lobosporangium transversale]KAF9899072.1 hypothetical protein BX616_003310 [Lobosporangium transversale]ORZ27405.1 hypothetical protein BCR41DRAFT_367753 [Lobosporangium transversale]|eukprot:XP_021885132.1 hypothetical protein BCR41DRAFT_367753 [Lobosporangium transversale]